MAEYIEREAVRKILGRYQSAPLVKMKTHFSDGMLTAIGSCIELVDVIPAEDVAPVVHGRWIKTYRGMREVVNTGEVVKVYLHDCSVCGWHTGNQGQDFNYCPNCGARMDGE